MWIKTQQSDDGSNCLVNLDKVEAVYHMPSIMSGNGEVVAQVGPSPDDYYTVFEGTKEDCEALLSWIFDRIDWAETFDVNDWIESHKPVNPDDFPEETGKADEADEIPF